MSSDQYYQHHPRTIIPVTVNPNDDQRFIRFRSSNAPSGDIVHDRMSARMREFEEECRRWREKFFNEPHLQPGEFPSSSSSLMHSKPRMRMDFPDFPEFGSIDWPTFRGSPPGVGTVSTGATQQTFIEEDKDGRKKYKIQFDIGKKDEKIGSYSISRFLLGEFRPEELNVKVEGRMLIVKGDRQVKVGNASESKQFNRELTLPEFVDVKSLQSYLADDGILTMEAPVLLDRVYNHPALPSSNTYRSASPNRFLESNFTSGGRQSSSNYPYGNNPSNSYSSTSSTSSFRQEGTGLRDGHHVRRTSPSRDPYSSTTSSTSTLIGGTGFNNNYNNNPPTTTTFSTLTSRPDYSTVDRYDGSKEVTYRFNLSEFAPEDIAIQVNDTMLKITALKEERSGHGSTHREFRREIGRLRLSSLFIRNIAV